MKQPFAICSVAFGTEYIKQLHRLKESIRNFYPEVEFFSWINSLPEGSTPHKFSPYGFKVHAVNAVRKQGYEKIVWMDTALVMKQELDYWFNLVPLYGVIAAKDDNKLDRFIDDRALKYFKLKRENIWNWHLVGGSLYVFDFSIGLCNNIFEYWEKAEADRMFYGEPGHRHDEAILAACLYKNGSEPTPYDVCRYNNGEDSIVVKKHFK